MTIAETYTNESYTKTVSLIKTTKGCVSRGWLNCVEVVTESNNGSYTKTERFYTTEDWLDYEDGLKYWSKWS